MPPWPATRGTCNSVGPPAPNGGKIRNSRPRRTSLTPVLGQRLTTGGHVHVPSCPIRSPVPLPVIFTGLVGGSLAILERTCILLHVDITSRCLSAENDLPIACGISELLFRPVLGSGVVLDPLGPVVIAPLLVDFVPCLLSHSVPNFGVQPFTALDLCDDLAGDDFYVSRHLIPLLWREGFSLLSEVLYWAGGAFNAPGSGFLACLLLAGSGWCLLHTAHSELRHMPVVPDAGRDSRQTPLSNGGGALTPLTQIPLEGGGRSWSRRWPGAEGPVKAGRLGNIIGEVPDTLRNVLEPITHAGQADLDQLHKAQPDEITVEFGVHRAVEAGVVITKGRAASHLQVTVPWKGDGG